MANVGNCLAWPAVDWLPEMPPRRRVVGNFADADFHCTPLLHFTLYHFTLLLFFLFLNSPLVASRPRASVDVVFLMILFEYLLGILIELLMLVEPQVGQDD